ncbi:MAG: hypothetical protein JWP27_2622, partial [Flaviaesturariibacter sp.]|nr:hypothetical protein [Flaviaesturariibacter sp.]
MTFPSFLSKAGRNKTAGHDGENGALLEGSYQVKRTAVYGRYEWVQKSAEELGLENAGFGHDAVFPVSALTMGGSHDLLQVGNTRVALGVQATIYVPDQRLTTLYGDTPLAGQVYLRIYPRAMGSQW